MGLATKILFLCALGVLLLGPKRLPEILGYITRAKAQLQTATRHVKSQLNLGLEAQHPSEDVTSYPKTAGQQ